MLDDIETIGA